MLRSPFIATLTTAALLTPTMGLARVAELQAKAAVLPLHVEGSLPPNGAESIEAKVAEGLESTGTAVMPSGELEGAVGRLLDDCDAQACWQEAASKSSSTHLVRPTVSYDGADYGITLEVIDGASGEVIQTVNDTCELCGLTDAADKASALAATLSESMVVAASPAALAVISDPSGATVIVDGQELGVTPLALELAPGEHDIVLRKEGYFDGQRMMKVESGSDETLEVTLDPEGPGEERRPSGVWGKIRPVLPWVSIGVGAAALGSGIALIAIDEKPVAFTRCDGNDVDHLGNCRFRHNTIVGGVMMAIIGVGGLAAGTVLLVLDRRNAKGGDKADDDRRVRLRPTHNGLALHF